MQPMGQRLALFRLRTGVLRAVFGGVSSVESDVCDARDRAVAVLYPRYASFVPRGRRPEAVHVQMGTVALARATPGPTDRLRRGGDAASVVPDALLPSHGPQDDATATQQMAVDVSSPTTGERPRPAAALVPGARFLRRGADVDLGYPRGGSAEADVALA
eukprot:gene21904-26530_t